MLIAAPATQEAAFSGWRMAALLFVVLNVVLGELRQLWRAGGRDRKGFGTSRALASAGPSVLTLAMGLLSPIAGSLMLRLPIKLLMMAGALASAGACRLLPADRIGLPPLSPAGSAECWRSRG